MTDDQKDPGPAERAPTVEELKERADAANKALADALTREHEKRTLGSFRTQVDEQREKHVDYIDRIEGYEPAMKARLFGFGAFTGKLGEELFVLAGSAYALEKMPNEDFTNLKTASETFGVVETPAEIFNEFYRVRFAYSEDSYREALAEVERREANLAKDGNDPARPIPGSRELTVADIVGTATPASPFQTHELHGDGPDFGSVSAAVSDGIFDDAEIDITDADEGPDGYEDGQP